MQTLDKKIKHQTINIAKASGTSAGTHEVSEQLDDAYDVIGVEAYENAGSAQPYKIGIKDNVNEHFQPTNKEALLTTKDVHQAGKKRPMNFDLISGRKTTVQLVFAANSTADVDVDVVFVLAKKDVKL